MPPTTINLTLFPRSADSKDEDAGGVTDKPVALALILVPCIAVIIAIAACGIYSWLKAQRCKLPKQKKAKPKVKQTPKEPPMDQVSTISAKTRHSILSDTTAFDDDISFTLSIGSHFESKAVVPASPTSPGLTIPSPQSIVTTIEL